MNIDTLPPEMRRVIRRVVKAMRAEFDKELEAAVEAERDAVLHGLKSLATLNGSGVAVMKALGAGDHILKATRHAPAGGATINGKEYVGGQFIPAEELAKATPEEKAALEGKAKKQSGQLGEWGRAAAEKEQEKGTEKPPKKPHEMTKEEFESELAKQDPNQFAGQYEVDWGSGRGQGKRVGGGGVRGSMSDAPRGKKTYTDPFASLDISDDERKMVNLQDQSSGGMDRYLQARAMGLSHDEAFATMIPDEEGGGHEALRRQAGVEDVAPAEPPTRTPKPLTVDQSEALARKLMSATGPDRAETVRRLTEAFSGHTRAELDELKRRLGVRASGNKADMARRIAERHASTDRTNRNLYANEKVSVDEAHERVKAAIADGSLATPEGVRAVSKLIGQGLTGEELKELKKRLGIKAGGAKADVARKIAERAATTATKPKPEVVPPQPPVEPAVTPSATNGVAPTTQDVAPKEPWEMTASQYQTSGPPDFGDLVSLDGKVGYLRGGSSGWGSGRVQIEDMSGVRHSGNKKDAKLIRRQGVGTRAEDGPALDRDFMAKQSADKRAVDDEYTDVRLKPSAHHTAEDKARLAEYQQKLAEIRGRELTFDIPNTPHKQAVRNALAAGKPVPAEVLADYPDLAPKAATAPAVQQPTQTPAAIGDTAPSAPLSVPELVARIREIDERNAGRKMSTRDRLDRADLESAVIQSGVGSLAQVYNPAGEKQSPPTVADNPPTVGNTTGAGSQGTNPKTPEVGAVSGEKPKSNALTAQDVLLRLEGKGVDFDKVYEPANWVAKKWNEVRSHSDPTGEELVADLIDRKVVDQVKGVDGATHIRAKKQSASAGKSSSTGVKRGGLKQISIQDLRFPGGLSDEVTPLHGGNANQPVIVKKVKGGYQIVDGFGRASGIKNAGGSSVHAILVSDADLDKNQSGEGDEAEWVKMIHAKYAPHSLLAG